MKSEKLKSILKRNLGFLLFCVCAVEKTEGRCAGNTDLRKTRQEKRMVQKTKNENKMITL